MNNEDLLEKLVMAEVSGKNNAIQAYDGMIWKVRTGFLTLLFAGWAVLLKGMADSSGGQKNYFNLTVAMLFFSLGLAVGGWFVDRAYVRRKFRVILALDRLMDAIRRSIGALDSIPGELLSVAGDNGDMKYDSSGYRETLITSACVFFLPLLTVIIAAYFLLRQ